MKNTLAIQLQIISKQADIKMNVVNYIWNFEEVKGLPTQNVDNCKLLKTIHYKDLTNWDVFNNKVFKGNTQKIIKFTCIHGKATTTMQNLAQKVEHMFFRINGSKTTYEFLHRCAYGQPKKIRLYNKYSEEYGTFIDDDRTDEYNEKTNAFKTFYKQIKPPKGHFRWGGIYTLTQTEQDYLKKLFE